MNFRNILVETMEQGIFKVALNRPQLLNPLNKDTLLELGDAFLALNDDPEVKVIILTGQGGKAFVAGADIEAMSTMTALEMRDYMKAFSRLNSLMSRCEKPIIGAVKGFCFGGGNIVAMHCDVVFATEDSSFGQQEINLGIVGGIARLIYVTGFHRAMDLLMTGRIINAQEAEQIGLVNQVVNSEGFDLYIADYARKLCRKSPVAMALVKNARTMAEKFTVELLQPYDDTLISICCATEDGREGMQAFVEKRKPQFKGE